MTTKIDERAEASDLNEYRMAFNQRVAEAATITARRRCWQAVSTRWPCAKSRDS